MEERWIEMKLNGNGGNEWKEQLVDAGLYAVTFLRLY